MFEKIIKSQLTLRKHRQLPLAQERESYLEYRWKSGASLEKLKFEAGYLLEAVKILKLSDSECSKVPIERIIWCTQVWSRAISVRHPDASKPKSDVCGFENTITCWLAHIGLLDDRYGSKKVIFNQLFYNGCHVRRYIAAPFYNERKSHLDHLKSLGYNKVMMEKYARFHLKLIEYLHLTELRCISSLDLEVAVKEWDSIEIPSHGKKSNGLDSHNDFLFVGKSWFSFLGLYTEVTELPAEYEYVRRYLKWIIIDKGYSSYTEKTRTHHLESFFRYLEKAGFCLADATPSVIDDYIVSERAKGYARATMAGLIATLKNFFLYAEQQRWCQPGLKDSILVARQYKEETLPSFVGWDVVRKVIESQDVRTDLGKRNKATMLLMATYGLRCCEVAGMKLKDIDWRREEIHIQRAKGGKSQVLPFVKEVGDAIISYIREARHNEVGSEYLFLRTRAPYAKLSAASLFAGVNAALKSQGVELRHYGPHALRHSCATHLVNSGHSIKEVADLLGHQKLDTTRLYAKVNLSALKGVAEMNWEEYL